MITNQIKSYLKKNTNLIITTKNISIDPNNITKAGIEKTKFNDIHYSSTILPGAIFLLKYNKTTSIIKLPTYNLYHKTTIFDLILPKLITNKKPKQKNLTKLYHGGLCLNYDPCRFPTYPFKKSN